MNTVVTNLKKTQRSLKQNYLLDISKQLYSASTKNNRRIPHKLVNNILNNSKVTCPWITRSVINKAFSKYKLERQKEECDVAMIMTNLSSTDQDTTNNTNNAQNNSPNDITAASNQPKG